MVSKEFRNDPLFLRNQFDSESKYGFAKIRKQELNLSDVKLLACSDTKASEIEYYKTYGVHFFVDDFRFEGIYKKPEASLAKYSQYAFLLTPDFSLYAEMPQWRQIENVGKTRWIGAYWQEKGLTVIPTVSWSGPRSFEFCFKTIEKGSIVAIGMIGCRQSKQAFMLGYNEMLSQIDPSAIICFGKPFDEMTGNIIDVDYISSRSKKRGA